MRVELDTPALFRVRVKVTLVLAIALKLDACAGCPRGCKNMANRWASNPDVVQGDHKWILFYVCFALFHNVFRFTGGCPLSPNSISWNRPMGDDALRLGR